MYAVTFPPKRQAFYWGLAIGCAGAGLTGLWQVYHLELERANGYTNAIQWGNVALLMATMLAIQLSVFWHEKNWMHRAGILFCIALGVEASILSASRGGWIALGAIIPLMGIFVFSYRRDLFKKFGLTIIVAAVLIAATNTHMLCDRFEKAQHEVSEYLQLSDKTRTSSSLGIRLEQYRTAVEMIKEKPFFGWGAREYLREMHQRVDDGRYAKSTRQFNFIHNEFIDLWVKTGIPGMLVQAFLYLYTLWIFWPTARRMKKREATPRLWREELALRLCGITLPVMYFVFGQSQHFFVHNIGIIAFTFFVIILWSTLSGLKDSEENISYG
ncbi:hypothetical protein GCM10007205_04900 [Oxalicibacterium flavum]|uniref:O-antigen ligase-related domain-containing protein n=2 Tax=Oxalicibacterium flavum TaxID=179467 RepID=A0A8J2ULA0_9BURK|nr:hypothetical protein GCM10007205_04900 [Oxalicibacterium flavum]